MHMDKYKLITIQTKQNKNRCTKYEASWHASPLRPKMFSISSSFLEILAKLYVCSPSHGGSATPHTSNPGSVPDRVLSDQTSHNGLPLSSHISKISTNSSLSFFTKFIFFYEITEISHVDLFDVWVCKLIPFLRNKV